MHVKFKRNTREFYIFIFCFEYPEQMVLKGRKFCIWFTGNLLTGFFLKWLNCIHCFSSFYKNKNLKQLIFISIKENKNKKNNKKNNDINYVCSSQKYEWKPCLPKLNFLQKLHVHTAQMLKKKISCEVLVKFTWIWREIRVNFTWNPILYPEFLALLAKYLCQRLTVL
jgi:hypothetical protein